MDGLHRPWLIEQVNLVVADRENLSGDPGGRIGAKEHGKRRDLFRRHALKRFDAALVLFRLCGYRLDHARERKRRNAVRPHVEPGHVERDAARKAHDAELGRHVVRLPEIADKTGGRRHVHEGARILLTEQRRDRAAHIERTIEMHGNHVGPVRPAHLVKNHVAQDSGIVDEDGEAAERFDRHFHDGCGVFWFGNRKRRRDRFSAGFFYGVDRFLCRAGIAAFTLQTRADVADHDTRTLFREQGSDTSPDAASCPCYDRNLAGNDARHQRPHISSATSTIIRSLAHCSSSASTLPSSVEAKPHCGDRHSLSSEMYLEAASMRRLISSFDSRRPVLVVTSPSTTWRSFGTSLSGSKPPARSVSYSMK